MSKMRDALQAAGVTGKDIHPGDVWLYPNIELFLSADKAAGRKPEQKYRPVIVVENIQHCQDPAHISVLVVAVSRDTDRKTDVSLLLPKGIGGLEHDSITLTHIMQPVLKRDLAQKIGELPETELNKVLVLIAISVGITP